MLFTEPLFFGFFLLVFAAYWGISGHRARKVLLLAASYVFYGAWDWRFVSLILASTTIDYVSALKMVGAPNPRVRKRWLLVSLTGNLGLLGFFKYCNFFIESANSFLSLFGEMPMRTLGIVLPVGISFYTFQTLSYSIDVYRGKCDARRDFLDFALFVAFFPQMVMGPILRAKWFLPQFDTVKVLRDVPFKSMLTLFAIGFVKKACISDNIAPLVDSFYTAHSEFDLVSLWIALAFYGVVIYCDFSGYTDMAIAIAGMLGFKVPKNFDFPLFARNMTDFWRRWHISFSSWLRDYLYYPLGGSRVGELRMHWNILFTMLVSGLWHGAGLHFILWGGLNGLALNVHKVYSSATWIPGAVRRLIGLPGPLSTYFWYCFTLIYFRSVDIDQALDITRAFLLFESGGDRWISPWAFAWFPPLVLAHWIAYRFDLPKQAAKLPDAVFAVGLGLVIALALTFVRTDYRPFIYFQF